MRTSSGKSEVEAGDQDETASLRQLEPALEITINRGLRH